MIFAWPVLPIELIDVNWFHWELCNNDYQMYIDTIDYHDLFSDSKDFHDTRAYDKKDCSTITQCQDTRGLEIVDVRTYNNKD